MQNHGDAALAAGNRMLALATHLRDDTEVARAHFGRCRVTLHCHDDAARALAHAQAALNLSQRAGNRTWTAWSLNTLGETPGNPDGDAAAELAAQHFRESGSEWELANALHALATWRAQRGDLSGSARLVREGVHVRREIGDRWGVVESLADAAALAGQSGMPCSTVRLAGAASSWKAAHVFSSPYTASKNVSNILGKPGVANRREAAALAARHGLV